MSNRKPIRGHPSQTAAILTLLNQGRTVAEIASDLKISRSTIRSLIAATTSAARSARRDRSAVSWSVTVDRETRDYLEPHAAQRGVAAAELLRQVLRAIADDDLLQAVLDDEGPR